MAFTCPPDFPSPPPRPPWPWSAQPKPAASTHSPDASTNASPPQSIPPQSTPWPPPPLLEVEPNKVLYTDETSHRRKSSSFLGPETSFFFQSCSTRLIWIFDGWLVFKLLKHLVRSIYSSPRGQQLVASGNKDSSWSSFDVHNPCKPFFFWNASI